MVPPANRVFSAVGRKPDWVRRPLQLWTRKRFLVMNVVRRKRQHPAGTKDAAGLMQRPQAIFMRKCVDHIVGGKDEVKRQVVEGAQIPKICLTDADLRASLV